MQKIITWLIVSSKDPQKVSLFIKGVLLGVLPTVVYFAGLAHLNVGQSDLKAVVEVLAQIIEVGLGLVSVVVALVGLVRKIWRTAQGENRALNDLE